MKNLKISMKLVVSFVILIAISIIASAMGVIGMYLINSADDALYNENVVALSSLGVIRENMMNQIVHTRDMALNGGDRDEIMTKKRELEDLEREMAAEFVIYEGTIVDNSEEAAYFNAKNMYLTDYVAVKNRIYEASLISTEDAIREIYRPETANVRAAIVSNLETSMVNNDTWAKERVDANTGLFWRMTFISVGALLLAVVIAIFFIFYISGLVAKPIKRLVDVAHNIRNGNLNVNIDTSANDETGELATSFKEMAVVINQLVNQIDEMRQKVIVEGDIDMKIDSSKFSGAYHEVAEGVNNLVGGIINDVLSFMSCLSKFGDGDFEANIPKLPGKKIVMNQALDNMRNNLVTVNTEVSTLVQSAIDGNLSKRVDIKAFKGDWANLMNRLNQLLEAVIAPINEAADVLAHVSKGDFSMKMKGAYKGDFLVIEEAINTTVTNISTYIGEIAKVLGGMANDDLNHDIKREYVGEFSEIKSAILNIIAKFNTVISGFASASEQVASGAKMISESSMTLATGATEQASSIQELNATIQTINENTRENAESAKEADTLSSKLKDNAEKGNREMAQMLSSMNDIKDSSSQISKIIKTIEEIASQTNLLALNAAVEAARAGEHGKGFTVVAGEVRNLAGKSQDAAKETAELIEESIKRVNDGTGIANKTAEMLTTIVEEAENVSDIITKISTASDEQALAIGQIMNGVNQITDVVQNNSATAEESASASEELASQSEILRSMTSVFTLKKV